MTFRRNVLMTMAVGGLLIPLTAAPALADHGVVSARGPLADLQPALPNATDGASALLVAFPDGSGGTRAVLLVTGIKDSVGTTYGAHAHTGPCQAGAPLAAGPHYNTTVTPPTAPTIINDQVELWLDFTVRPGGVGIGRATVPFVIANGKAQSIVIHEMATDQNNGVAGPRQACLPVNF